MNEMTRLTPGDTTGLWQVIERGLARDGDFAVRDHLAAGFPVHLRLITGGMEFAGMGSLSVAAVTSGAATGGIAAARDAATGARNTVTGGMAGGLAVVWVVGSVAYVALQSRMTQVGHEITRRYQAHSLPAALYQKAFGEDVPMPEQFPGRAR